MEYADNTDVVHFNPLDEHVVTVCDYLAATGYALGAPVQVWVLLLRPCAVSNDLFHPFCRKRISLGDVFEDG